MKKIVIISMIMMIMTCLSAVTWQIALYDSYGDGWNGGMITVFVNGSAVLTDITLSNGYGPEYHNISIANGDELTTDYTQGSYSSENEYQIIDHNGNVVAIQGADDESPGDITTPLVASIIAGTPDPASNPNPAHQATNVPINGNLSWDFGADTDAYDLWFGPTGSMVQVVDGEASGASGSFAYNDLPNNAQYSWRVDTINNTSGITSPGPVWTFATALPEGLVEIGSGSVTGYNLPLNPYYGYNYSQTIYLQSEINVSGQRIEKLFYDWNGLAAGTNTKDWTIYMGHTPKTAFSSVSDWVPFADLTAVFSGVVTLPASPGWVEIVLTLPFAYDNTDNLVIAVNEYTPEYDGDLAKFFGTSVGAYRGLRLQNDSSPYDPASPDPGARESGIANIALQFGEIPTDPVFYITPVEKDYGVIDLGTSASQTFTIVNTGLGTLTIDHEAVTIIGENASEFMLSPISTDFNLSNGQTAEITITFIPSTTGTKTAQLQIFDNTSPGKMGVKSGAKATHLVNLSGVGHDSTISSLPYIQTWEVDELRHGWGVYDFNSDGIVWGLTGEDNNAIWIGYNSYQAMNDWVVSPPVVLTGGETYTVTYQYRAYSSSYPENLRVAYGDTQYPASLTNVIADHFAFTNTEYVTGSGTITPAEDGNYFVGFQGYSDADLFYIYLDDIRILPVDTQIGQGVVSGGSVDIEVPELEGISPHINIDGLTNGAVIQAVAGYSDAGLPNAGLSLSLSGANFSGATISIDHNMGFVPQQIAYKILPGGWVIMTSGSSEVLTWNETSVIFTLAVKADGDLEIVFPMDGDSTLPVTLSSFTAVLTADMHVNLTWVAETEVDHAGYNVLRSEVKELSTAIFINTSLIDEGQNVGTQVKYNFLDKEVYHNAVYYYWLENVDLNGETEYYGPITAYVNADGEGPGIPEIPLETKLFAAFPNPFNPATNLRYSMKEAGDVRIDVFNVKGQILKTYHNSHNQPGYYQVSWDGRDLNGRPVSTGVYFYRMTSGKYRSTKKMVLAK